MQRKTSQWIYLDYNATTPLRGCALARMALVFEQTGNPYSVHTVGRRLRQIMEESRTIIAENVGATADQVIFTSGGTEANHLALQGLREEVSKIFVGSTEHASIDALFEDKEIASAKEIVPVDDQGLINFHAFQEMLEKTTPPFLVSIMLANNETGVIQDISSLAHFVHAHGGYIHTDAAQAVGKVPVDFKALGVDLMTLSAHKLGGPPGVGALIMKKAVPLKATLQGGGQERGMRAGTPSVALIAGFAAALAEAKQQRRDGRWKQNQAWHFSMEQSLKSFCGDILILGETAPRLPGTTCLTMPNASNENQVIAFDLEGICVSAGSACSSGKVESSHVLTRMGLPAETAKTAIRVSSGWKTCEEDLLQFTNIWKKIYPNLTQKRPR